MHRCVVAVSSGRFGFGLGTFRCCWHYWPPSARAFWAALTLPEKKPVPVRLVQVMNCRRCLPAAGCGLTLQDIAVVLPERSAPRLSPRASFDYAGCHMRTATYAADAHRTSSLAARAFIRCRHSFYCITAQAHFAVWLPSLDNDTLFRWRLPATDDNSGLLHGWS